MQHVDIATIGSVLTTTVLIGTLLWRSVRVLGDRMEARHKLTESHLAVQLTDTKNELTVHIANTEGRLTTSINAVKNEVQEIDGNVKDNTRAIAFLRERTAGLESAVFHRPPVTEETLEAVGGKL